MIKEKFLDIIDGELAVMDESGTPLYVCHYSDENKYIVQTETGAIYEDAVDIYPCKYHYTESDEIIIRGSDENAL